MIYKINILFKLLKLIFIKYIFVIIYIVGLIIFCIVCKHFLIILLRLEFIIISLFLGLFFILTIFDYELYFLIVFIIIVVSEGVLGLAILVSIIRTHGNDYFQRFNILW